MKSTSKNINTLDYETSPGQKWKITFLTLAKMPWEGCSHKMSRSLRGQAERAVIRRFWINYMSTHYLKNRTEAAESCLCVCL